MSLPRSGGGTSIVYAKKGEVGYDPSVTQFFKMGFLHLNGALTKVRVYWPY
jgi:hypothetical protein